MFPLFLSEWLLLSQLLSMWTQTSCCCIDTFMMGWLCSLTRRDKAGWSVLVYYYQMWHPAVAQQYPKIRWSRVSNIPPSLCPSFAKQHWMVFCGLCVYVWVLVWVFVVFSSGMLSPIFQIIWLVINLALQYQIVFFFSPSCLLWYVGWLAAILWSLFFLRLARWRLWCVGMLWVVFCFLHSS